MTGTPERPLAWQYCGNQLKLWRERAGVTRERLAEEAEYDYETVKSMEQGRRKPTLKVLQAAEQLCDARGLLLAAAGYLRPERFPHHARSFVAVEDEAIVLNSYESLLIPGLLQTAEYARALIAHRTPPLDDDAVEARVQARLERQQKLTRTPPILFSFTIFEAALRTRVGGPEAMRRQLQHLLETGQLRNVSIQVLPVDSGADAAALVGPFVLVETGDHQRYAYVEGQATGALYSDAQTVSTLEQRHGMIRMQALGVGESARFIEGLMEEL
ncbi:helix-turn-helix transcriptional regulator [Kitasatospora sp. NBC_01287]|uniref:helix-turn-helix domain-containing protein n=1 Tax=Kitasatospora sp. NBC_01287 TaxID=2903573 RepID=UPI00224E5A19|nr:helix-turn-helix transcriptional regulator [Kitasatospora sp. NBC_01287]MCX4748161.1 helix-turn-helix transcriptional regulator [Kitasatospora sp. NBC_01287]